MDTSEKSFLYLEVSIDQAAFDEEFCFVFETQDKEDATQDFLLGPYRKVAFWEIPQFLMMSSQNVSFCFSCLRKMFSPTGKSALHWAAAVNNVEATLLLLKNGANRDMQDNKVQSGSEQKQWVLLVPL